MPIIPRPSRPALLLAALAVIGPAGAATAQCGSGYQRWFDRYDSRERPERYYYRYYRGYPYLSPYFRNSGRHLVSPGGSGLMYHRYTYGFSRYFEDRKTYPHTIDGQFGRPRRGEGLNLRFYQGPGFSPFGREHFFEAWYEDPPRPTPPPEEESPGPQTLPPAQPTVSPDVVVQPAPDGSDGSDAAGIPEGPDPSPLVRGPRQPPAPRPRPPHDQAGPDASDAPARSRPRDRATAPPRPRIVIEDRRHSSSTPEEERAWTLLGRGQFESAQFAFCSVALAYPRNARPKAGLALSIALKDRHADAAFLMRRAFKVNPGPLLDLRMTEDLEPRIRKLLKYYGGPDHELPLGESLFMRGVLHFLLGEEAPARDVVREAMKLGDDGTSIHRLRIMLHMPNDAEDRVPVQRQRRIRKDLSV